MGWPGRAQRLICWTAVGRREARLKEHAMRTSQSTPETISTIGIDDGKNTFHLVGLDKRGEIVLQQKVTRHQLGLDVA
jgi:transposase